MGKRLLRSGMRRRLEVLGMAVALAGGCIAMAGPAGADSDPYAHASGPLSDLATDSANATDGAAADLYGIPLPGSGSSLFILTLSGLDPAAEGTTFGAHIHTGSCVAGNGAAAKGHYNTGDTPSPDSEVWLDFTVLPGGWAFSETTVPFVIAPGAAHALVIHAQPTQSDGDSPGAAGPRMACIPVEF